MSEGIQIFCISATSVGRFFSPGLLVPWLVFPPACFLYSEWRHPTLYRVTSFINNGINCRPESISIKQRMSPASPTWNPSSARGKKPTQYANPLPPPPTHSSVNQSFHSRGIIPPALNCGMFGDLTVGQCNTGFLHLFSPLKKILVDVSKLSAFQQ